MSYSNIEQMAIEDDATPDEAEMLAERLNSKFPKEHIYQAKVSPVAGKHVSPHMLGDRG